MFEIKDFGFGVYVLLPSNFIEAYFSPFFLAHVQIFPQTNLVSYFFLFVAIFIFSVRRNFATTFIWQFI